MKGNIVLQVEDNQDYTPENIHHKLNIGGLADLFKYTRVIIPNDGCVDDISRVFTLLDADVKRYKKGSNEIIDTVLDSVGFMVVKIVDDDGKDLIELNK